MNTGTLYGIGVGPGDPELIPLKAVRILQGMDMVFTAASTKNEYSLAVDIARPHLPDTATIEKLSFPMSSERSIMSAAWHENAGRIAAVLEEGRSAAFLTVGDPLTYSTFGYILRCLQAGWPHLAICTVPGITSYHAAAAATNQPLVEGEESLLIMSGVNGGRQFDRMAHKPQNVVFLKAYRKVEEICQSLEKANMLPGSVAVANCTREDQKIYKNLKMLDTRQPNYWTLIIAGQRQDDNGDPN